MPWPKTGTSHLYVQLGLSEKGRESKELVVCNGLDLEPLDLLKDLVLGCSQTSEV